MASFQLEFYSWEQIMIAKITLVSMLAAVALARPEADPQFYHHGYHHGVVGHVHPTCEQGVDTLEVQSCAPRVDKICNTVDVVSEEITYEKRCKEVVSKTCSPIIVKRSAEAEPEADPQFGYGHFGHYGYAAPVTYALPEIQTKTIETPCAEHTSEHCVDVPIIKEIVTPVETCHDVTKVDCTPADHNIAKVTCTPGQTTVTDLAATYGLVPAAAPAAVEA